MIGKLRDRITIERRIREPDGYGGFTESWTTFATVWAQVKPVSARERMFAQKLEGNITHMIRIRHLDGVTADMRIGLKGRVLKIAAEPINVDERGRWLDLTCEEGTGS